MAEHTGTLPEGITAAEWGLERVGMQNPLIRAFLSCLKQLDEVVESDYHLMHCSPARLKQVWQQLRELASTIRSTLPPVLEGQSKIPDLEAAREAARQSLKMLEGDLLSKIDTFPEEPVEHQRLELRELLCVAMGALQAFLHAAFGEIMAADPRSSHDTDYYLSRRLPRDVQEAQWLRQNVLDLGSHLESLGPDRERLLVAVRQRLVEEGELPEPAIWMELSAFLVGLYNHLPTRLKEILCLQGIRFEEMSTLNRHCVEIPTKCLSLFEIHEHCAEILELLDALPAETVRARYRTGVTRRLARLLGEVDASLVELACFAKLWLQDIERRRALVFAAADDGPETAGPGV